ncbi:MAG TPA: LysM peptidoglycan-binding domain-containing protein [Nitrospirae bacterium]|nr:lysM domain/BON superfamily protein [bacterium BMS3Abin06]HDH11481.1 LysM peptidoglycan-binding domain-containing protein [Nitrospirota bacterium]HDZ01365.1 LysM peptidoglycan-binding domain-containing protein [Nitrospirota bacterium]
MRKMFYFLLLFSVFFVTSLHALDTTREEYIVEKKDTLWDISESKLEDPFLWPKLWSVNPHIKNPDLIYPGTKIIIPSREELMRMPLKKIPAFLKPKYRKPQTKSVFRFAPERQQKYIVNKNLYIASGWIADRFPGIGEITYSPMNRQITGKGDYVYIKINEESMPGNRYFAIRDIKTVKHPVTGKEIGHQIRITGILEVTGTDNNMTQAKVIESFQDIQIGDALLPYKELEPPLVPDKPRTPDMQGYIIETHTNSYLISPGDIIFLDKGANDGLETGDVFSVLSERPAVRSIGKIQIVSLQPATSGAVLLKSEQEVTIGTKWGQK